MPTINKTKNKYFDTSDNESDYDEINMDNTTDTDNDSDTDDEFNTYNKQELDDNDIKNIIFEKINKDYSYGKYGDFSVIVMNKNGYINATKLCNKSKKKLKQWLRNKNSLNMVNAFSKSLNINKNDLVIVIKGGKLEKITGTYVHPDIIPHIASWASHNFAIKVSAVMKEYSIKKVKEESEKLLAKKDDKIDELLKENKSQSKKMDKLLENNKELLENNKILLSKTIKSEQRLKSIKKDTRELKNTVGEICKNRVIPTGNDNDINHLILIQNNNDDDDEDEEDGIVYEYHVFRVMENNKSALTKHKQKYHDMKILLDIKCTPNAVILWKRIKNKLGLGKNKKINVNGCKLNLVGNYSENRLIDDIKKLHDERLDY
jgi:hypothetical protein